MRNFGLVVRAGGPRRSQASSLRSSCWRLLSRRALLAVALGAGEHVRGVATLVLVDRAVGHLPGGGAHGVQEPAVVRDHEHRAAPRRQVPSEPIDAFHVQMVGGLVEQQQLRWVQQQARERHAPALTAG